MSKHPGAEAKQRLKLQSKPWRAKEALTHHTTSSPHHMAQLLTTRGWKGQPYLVKGEPGCFQDHWEKCYTFILQSIIIYLWPLILECTLWTAFFLPASLKPDIGAEKYQENKAAADAFPWCVLCHLPSKPKTKAVAPISTVSTCTHFMISTAWMWPKFVISQQTDLTHFLN